MNLSNPVRLPIHRSQLRLLVGAACMIAASAVMAQPRHGVLRTPGIDKSGVTRHEVMSCEDGMTQQDKATCLKEARNAALDKKRGVLEESSSENYAANRMARCDVFNDAEAKAACIARVRGLGETEGNVSQGGVLTESETIKVPAGASSVRINPKTDRPILLVPRNNP